MEQSDNMAVQIGNIVANEIMRHGEIYLQGVGSLYVESLPSKINSSSGEISAPCRVVRYSDQILGRSIVDIIMQLGGCDLDTAENIYSRWRDGATREGGVEIINVGVVANGDFTIFSQLDTKLNPDLQKAILPRRRKGVWRWLLISVVGCVVAGLAVNGIMSAYFGEPKEVKRETPKTAEREVIQEAQEVVAVEEVIEQEVATPIQQEPTVDNTTAEGDLRYRVVYGVYSTPENVKRGMELAKGANPNITTRVYPYGDLYLVSIFESMKIEDCERFMESNKGAYSDLWIHKRKDI